MASPATLPLSDIVDVIIQVAPQAPAQPSFNQGLIVGPSAHIQSVGGVNPRIRQYNTLAQMASDGFLTTDPEYIAASLYFEQSPPPNVVWIGRQDLTAITGIAVNAGGSGYVVNDDVVVTEVGGSLSLLQVTAIANGVITALVVDAGGAGYAVNDVVTVVQAGGALGTAKVTTVAGGVVTGLQLLTGGSGYADAVGLATTGGTGAGLTVTINTIANGVVTGLSIIQGGTGYAVANALATTGGTGAGLTVNVTTVGETALAALQACRSASLEWWACMVTDAAKADHIAIAAWIETATPVGCYFYTTADADALSGAAGNVFSVLKAASYKRSIGIYSTTQSATFPNNAYACAAIMGVAMGQNTGLADSAYTLKFKTLVGVATEPLTVTSIGVIEGNNGNVYLSYGNAYSILEQGTMANGSFFDELVNLDMLASQIQFNIMNLLVGSPKIPQTDAGQTQLIAAVTDACEAAFTRGFIGSGVWEGVQILKLLPGATLPKGYSVQSPAYSTQAATDRQARKSMPIYVALIESGAVHFVTIGIYVQR